MSDSNNSVDSGRGEEREESVDRERREALQRMGKFAIFTPPVVMTLLTSKQADAFKGSGRPVKEKKQKRRDESNFEAKYDSFAAFLRRFLSRFFA